MTLLELLFLFGSGTAEAPAPPPAGPPTALVDSLYGSNLVRLSWTSGDLSAYTRIYQKSGGCGGGAVLFGTVNPGVQTFDTEWPGGGPPDGAKTGWEVRHYKDGQESAASNCVETFTVGE